MLVQAPVIAGMSSYEAAHLLSRAISTCHVREPPDWYSVPDARHVGLVGTDLADLVCGWLRRW